MDSTVVLTDLISTLGGPSISHRDIAWVQDVPTGETLVRWMVEQVQEPANYVDANTISTAALKRVALEDEELMLWKEIGTSTADHGLEMPTIFTPSSIRGQVGCIDAECALVENEAEHLRLRLKQTTLAAQRLKKTVKNLQTIVKDANTELDSRKRHLHELSQSSDGVIARTTSSVQPLLDLLCGCPNQSLTTSLEVLSTYHQRVSSLAEERRAYIDNLEALSPSVEEVKQEARRLDRTLAPFRTSYVELSGHAYSEELSSICLQLDDRTLIDRSLKDMLKSLESGDDAGAIVSSSEMQAEIEKAWMMDQLELLRSRECITEQTLILLNTHLSKQMQTLRDDLASQSERNFEAECVVNALLEELEEIADNAEDAKAGRPELADDTPQAQDILQLELTDTLKRLQDFRPTTEPPLVLLDRTDLKNELDSVKRRDLDSRRQETEWLSSLFSQLSSLSEDHEPLLSAIYKNAPLNASAPFAAPAAIRQLENEARSRARSMSTAIVQLQKDTEISSRTRKKLDAFVEKWGNK